MKIKPATTDDARRLHEGIQALICARNIFAECGADKTAARVRLALSSAKGAERHIWHRVHRTEKAQP